MDMPEDEALLKNRTAHGPEPSPGAARPAWAVTALASVLIFTTVVDVLGNLLVIVSVLRNRKLRNAGVSEFCCGHFKSQEVSNRMLRHVTSNQEEREHGSQ